MSQGQRTKRGQASQLAVGQELAVVTQAWIRHGLLGLPLRVIQALVRDSSLDGVLSQTRLLDMIGDNALALFNDLGPIYGKAGQLALSRLSPRLQKLASMLRLTRLYGDWPPIPFEEVKMILDAEIPRWRQELTVEPQPLGVASIAQAHGAVDQAGRSWVIKIVKPAAKRRLLESVAAIEQAVQFLEPLALTLVAKRSVAELRDLCRGFRQELSLTRERETIEKVHEKLKSKRQKVLLIPEVLPAFSTDAVLTVERFRGVSLADVVDGRVLLSEPLRQKLARTMLQELLVQVFELGLFHADPHAGNLILLEDGSVGLFDWGLAGELRESDRKHIAAILRSVMSLSLDGLVDALVEMGEESNKKVPREKIVKELKAFSALLKKGKDGSVQRPSLQQLLEASLRGADRLGIPVPEGLLLMAKSLITIEGLARGIDPKVSMARVASPVLWRAAKPGMKDLMALTKRLPQLIRHYGK